MTAYLIMRNEVPEGDRKRFDHLRCHGHPALDFIQRTKGFTQNIQLL